MLKNQMHSLTSFDRDGFALMEAILQGKQLDELTDAVEVARSETSLCAPGMRHLLQRSEAIRSFATSDAVRQMAESVLGAGAIPVRGILFDKTPASNWYVTWHQDLTIAVKQRVDIPGFGPWSTKDGVLHVQPPAGVLEQMMSMRIHLDRCPAENGAIKFIAGSHKAGIMDPPEITAWKTEHPAVCLPAERGDIIVMRPLILHSSSVSEHPDQRRVLHLEYANVELPTGLDWAEA